MKNSHHEHDEHFVDDDEIEQIFTGQKSVISGKPPFDMSGRNRPKILKWFKSADHHLCVPHHQKIGGYDCNHIVDEWLKWAIRTPAKANPITLPGLGYGGTNIGTDNPFLFKKGDASFYFTAVSPFRNPDTIRIFIDVQVPVLIPVYFAETSIAETPSLKRADQLMNLIKTDLAGITELESTFDGDDSLFGCCVLRKTPLPIENIPKDNILGIPEHRLRQHANEIELYHGGLWLLLKAENFEPGDHLLHFKSTSVNYEIEGKIQITALV